MGDSLFASRRSSKNSFQQTCRQIKLGQLICDKNIISHGVKLVHCVTSRLISVTNYNWIIGVHSFAPLRNIPVLTIGFLSASVPHSAFLDGLWQTVIKGINVLQTFIFNINEDCFLYCVLMFQKRGSQGLLWSPQSFYLPLFTLAKVLSGVLVWPEGCNTLQWKSYRKGNRKLCVLLSAAPF